MLRKFFVAIPVAVLAVGGTTACASKKTAGTSSAPATIPGNRADQSCTPNRATLGAVA